MSDTADYLALTKAERKRLERAKEFIDTALTTSNADTAAYAIQQAEDQLRSTTRDQFWRIR
jgi:hypothetical protein